ncbi:MAG: peptidoglycan DD-metalloendopeptidase family protein [Ottowia sp.]|jgi:lipoprotein NlpD|uniref:peptidoglycan DD-metalloendopeptidase family protein n=1 Tax=Ottowia beijingensis TaxID=1207057 RepID=UPI001B675293|nr:peptidoglycan DD-metalloendopeptidase family protein [Ottowia sp.]MBP7532045.1 peptidoglycan DD-metalloendopeptidase family protein [Ottowia sp.]MBP7537082.1 peptidoglycan DD-metalloendopeptidase family protein [Ottowia sp.]
MYFSGRKTWMAATLVAAAVLAGCSSTSVNRAPVEDRGTAGAPRVDPATLPGAENAGKPGFYTVRQGDTIMRIATEVNQPWRDIARWNNLDNPNLIEVGQVLRVVPPAGTTVASAPALTEGPRPAAGTPAPAPAPAKPAVPVATQTTPGVTPAPAPAPASPPPPPSAGADDVDFIWPASGALIAGFDEAKNKGLGIAGKAGDAVLAAADGRVVYAGAGLRGYGNLIILKHNNTFLTAYAHNQTLLVKEDQTVKKGQKIAEMGSTDADRVKLHFEIRRSGKPVDPARYLPAR